MEGSVWRLGLLSLLLIIEPGGVVANRGDGGSSPGVRACPVALAQGRTTGRDAIDVAADIDGPATIDRSTIDRSTNNSACAQSPNQQSNQRSNQQSNQQPNQPSNEPSNQSPRDNRPEDDGPPPDGPPPDGLDGPPPHRPVPPGEQGEHWEGPPNPRHVLEPNKQPPHKLPPPGMPGGPPRDGPPAGGGRKVGPPPAGRGSRNLGKGNDIGYPAGMPPGLPPGMALPAELFPQSGDAEELSPNQAIYHRLAVGKIDHYRVHLEAGQYLSLIIGQGRGEVVISLLDPAKQELLQVQGEKRIIGGERLSIVSAQTGVYQIAIAANPTNVVEEENIYVIRVAALRVATPD